MSFNRSKHFTRVFKIFMVKTNFAPSKNLFMQQRKSTNVYTVQVEPKYRAILVMILWQDIYEENMVLLERKTKWQSTMPKNVEIIDPDQLITKQHDFQEPVVSESQVVFLPPKR